MSRFFSSRRRKGKNAVSNDAICFILISNHTFQVDNSDTVENQGKGEVDQYALELRKHDFKVFFSPVLSYRIVVESCKRFVKQLQEKSVSAVALTSPRAADALSWALVSSETIESLLNFVTVIN